MSRVSSSNWNREQKKLSALNEDSLRKVASKATFLSKRLFKGPNVPTVPTEKRALNDG